MGVTLFRPLLGGGGLWAGWGLVALWCSGWELQAVHDTVRGAVCGHGGVVSFKPMM